MVATSPKKSSKDGTRPKTAHSKRKLIPETPTRRTPRKKQIGADDAPETPIPQGSAKKPRQAARCTKCPGRPLRIQCIHTKPGAKYVQEQAAMEALRNPTPAPEVPDCQSSPSRSTPLPNAPPPASDLRQQLPHLPSHSDVFLVGAGSSSPDDATPSPSMQSTLAAEATSSASGLDTPSTATASTPSTSSSVSKPKQVRTTASNPYNGLVVGSFRGEVPFKVIRGHDLPALIKDTKKATKQFHSSIASIIERCEDLAHQTGCWIFLGAQHPTAKLDAVNYASPRLRRDASIQAGQIASNFCHLSSKLIRAKNSDTMILADELEQSRQETQAAQEALNLVEETKLEVEAQLERYKMRYGILD